MRELLAHSWWHLALRGAVAVAFGILALAWPGLTLLLLVALFAAYALISGVSMLLGAWRNRSSRGQWWLALLGVVGVAAGIITLFYPGITALALVLIMGANAVVSGALEISMAVRLRREIRGEWLLGLAGAVSIAFGVLVFLFPGAGALALVWLIAAYAILSGVLFIALGLRLRSAGGTPSHSSPMPPPGAKNTIPTISVQK